MGTTPRTRLRKLIASHGEIAAIDALDRVIHKLETAVADGDATAKRRLRLALTERRALAKQAEFSCGKAPPTGPMIDTSVPVIDDGLLPPNDISRVADWGREVRSRIDGLRQRLISTSINSLPPINAEYEAVPRTIAQCKRFAGDFGLGDIPAEIKVPRFSDSPGGREALMVWIDRADSGAREELLHYTMKLLDWLIREANKKAEATSANGLGREPLPNCEATADKKLSTSTLPKGRKGKRINEKAVKMLLADPDLCHLSAERFSRRLNCTKSTLLELPVWQTIMAARALRNAEKLLQGKKIDRRRNGRAISGEE